RRALIGLRILAQGLLPEHRLGCDDGPAGVTDVVRAFGGHQGQDLPGVIASLALRTGGRIDPVLDAFTAGDIVRGYPMRGTRGRDRGAVGAGPRRGSPARGALRGLERRGD